MQQPRVPAVLCIDVEPDEQQVPLSERRPWTGFEAALEAQEHHRLGERVDFVTPTRAAEPVMRM